MPNVTLPKIACVGAGYWGQNLIRNFAELGALQLICEADQSSLEHFGSLNPGVGLCQSIETALRDPDVTGMAIAKIGRAHV